MSHTGAPQAMADTPPPPRPVVERQLRLQHLPSRGQNVFYTLILLLSPLLNLLVNAFTYQDLRQAVQAHRHSVSALSWSIGLSGFLLASLLALLWANLALALWRHHHTIRRTLLLFGVVSSLYLIDNLITLAVAIFAVKIQSIELLLIAIGIYLSVNMVFLFWYWYLDYPSHIRQLHHPDQALEILFPENALPGHQRWLPGFLDYLFFTVITSNTLGPPESHVVLGRRGRLVQMLHSVIMLVLLVIVVSRAINTLV